MMKRTTHDGKIVNVRTAAWLREAERKLGYPLTVVQGSYNTGVTASAGTHNGGGVVDLAWWDWENKYRVLRAMGIAAYPRTEAQGFTPHIHCVDIGDPELSVQAKVQAQDYYKGLDGLKYHRTDTYWRPRVIKPYVWPKPVTIRGKFDQRKIRAVVNALTISLKSSPNAKIKEFRNTLRAAIRAANE